MWIITHNFLKIIMKIQKFQKKFSVTREQINIKEEIFLALSDKRYLDRLSRNAKFAVIDGMSFEQQKLFMQKNKMYKKGYYASMYKSGYYGSSFELKEKKLKELKEKEFVPIKTDPKKALKQALNLLNTGFTLNKNVKKNAYHIEYGKCYHCDNDYCTCGEYSYEYTTVNYELRDKEYKEKTKIIKKVINLIKNNLLPIKYGKNEGIIYFEYCGRQVSFHDPKNQIKNVKKFNGCWTGVKNKKIPFTFLTKD